MHKLTVHLPVPNSSKELAIAAHYKRKLMKLCAEHFGHVIYEEVEGLRCVVNPDIGNTFEKSDVTLIACLVPDMQCVGLIKLLEMSDEIKQTLSLDKILITLEPIATMVNYVHNPIGW